ncbi:MAG: cystathionine gamma-synthase, partial [Candidatus Cloacimonadota bacterium]
ITMGADIIVHSTTKYIGGHCDLIGGAIIISKKEIYEQLAFYQNTVGAIPGPMDCWLVLRGIKTLAIRMEQHTANAITIANYLENQKRVKKVYYPGLLSHPQHQLARKQMKGFGGMISFEIDGDIEIAKKFVTLTRYFSLAESLGGVESLIEHPASMTHASIQEEERLKSGLTDNLIRISVGIENVQDLMQDLDQAFKGIR